MLGGVWLHKHARTTQGPNEGTWKPRTREEKETPGAAPRAAPAPFSIRDVNRRRDRQRSKICMLKRLSARLAEKWEKPCSEVCGCINMPERAPQALGPPTDAREGLEPRQAK